MSDSEAGTSKPQSFESQLQEQYITRLDQVEEGQLITGHVIEVGPETVFVDVGLKSEGRIPLDEFDKPPHVKDEVNVVLLRKEGRHGEVVVSKRKADEQVVWRALKESDESGEPVQGRVSRKIKGGYEVDLGADLRAFVPFSKVDVMRVRDEDAYIGLETRFFVEQLYNRGKVNIVLNRKSWLEREARKKRDQFYESAAVGDVYRGMVKTFTSVRRVRRPGRFRWPAARQRHALGSCGVPQGCGGDRRRGERQGHPHRSRDPEGQSQSQALHSRSMDHVRRALRRGGRGDRQGEQDHRLRGVHRDRTGHRGPVAHLGHVVGQKDRPPA